MKSPVAHLLIVPALTLSGPLPAAADPVPGDLIAKVEARVDADS
jgi:hypothetical protein